jgi:hypothetical protein
MFRRMALSIFGGALLAVVFAFSQTGMAACEGRCADTQSGGQEFDSCLVTYTCPTGSPCYESDVRCYYTGVKIVDPE